MLWGMNIPLTLFISSLVGIWLMFAPWIFGLSPQVGASDSDHLVGALVVTFAVIAMAEVGRPLRFLNVLFGV